MSKKSKFRAEVVDYIYNNYPDIAYMFTNNIIDDIVDDCMRNTDDETDPFTTLYECDYINDWIIGFLEN